jgi:hypothetical protein
MVARVIEVRSEVANGERTVMKKTALCLIALSAILILTEAPASAQIPGMGSMMGGATGGRPRRKLKRSAAPVLSPALNLVPGFSQSFEGQFLLRQVPMEQINRNTAQVGRQFDRLQNQINQQEAQIATGVGKTGHTASYMNYGGYYAFGNRRR